MDGEALLLDPDDLEHAEVLELVQHQLLVVKTGGLLHVGLDTSDVPGVGVLQNCHQHGKLHPARDIGCGGFVVGGGGDGGGDGWGGCGNG